MSHAIKGLWPALLSPVTPQGLLDVPRSIAHARHLLAQGSDGVTLFGTTGEGTAFTVAQRKDLVEQFIAAGIPGTRIALNITALALDDAIELGRHAMQHQVATLMLMPPFYFNAPRDNGIVQAVSYVLRGINNPATRLLLYHFPDLSKLSISDTAISELVALHGAQIAGVKDSSGQLDNSIHLAKSFPQLAILVGCEPHVAPTMQVGGAGSINGLANLAPRLMRRVIDHPSQVSASDAALMQGLLHLLSVKPNMPFVSAYKTALAEQTQDQHWLNVCPPLSRLTADEEAAVRQAYRELAKNYTID